MKNRNETWTGNTIFDRAAAGVVAGGLAGQGVTRVVDPAREDAYWRENFSERPYVEHGSSYNEYGPAYIFGVDAAGRYPGHTFEEVESEMSRQWNEGTGASILRWESARHAVCDAWNRVNGAF